MGDQIVIKVLLITALVVLMAILLVPGKGARPLAIRRLTYLLLLVAAIAAVIFPNWLSWTAALVGVGRGTDLLLYGLVVVFISHSMSSKSRHVESDRRFTALARRIAIDDAEPASEAGRRLADAE
ncbi:MAG: DUF2304 domain-containing protein [Propionibacterium sp.]|jgi:hypothetical protein|nr:DUF2304 domain-containing protein [Propionibacterium sp.]